MKFSAGFLVGLVCMVGHAHAADLPANPPISSVQGSWTGFHAGLNAGIGISDTTARGLSGPNPQGPWAPGLAGIDDYGFSGGLQAGFTWQLSPNAVIGIEGDIGYLGIDRGFTDWNGSTSFETKTSGYSTLRGRLGYTAGPWLLYLTGGGAWVRVKNEVGGLDQPSSVANSEFAGGWTVGGGLEAMLAPNWSARMEYLYIDVGRQTLSGVTRGGPQDFRFDNRFHVARFGVNYLFGGGPAVAPTVMKTPAAPPATWTGVYAGLNAGIGTSTTVVHGVNRVGSTGIVDHGFAGGVQTGVNWQFAPHWLAGIEGDIGYLRINDKFVNYGDFDDLFGLETSGYATIRGRIGILASNSLLYLTGGAAFVWLKDIVHDTPDPAIVRSKTASGWTIGGGLETKLAGNWSAKVEYLYIDADEESLTDTVGEIHRFENRFHVVRLGLNYLFDGTP